MFGRPPATRVMTVASAPPWRTCVVLRTRLTVNSSVNSTGLRRTVVNRVVEIIIVSYPSTFCPSRSATSRL